MNKKPHICPYCGSPVKPITNSDILKAIGNRWKMKTKTEHIVFDYSEAPKYRLVCLICGSSKLVKLPLEIDELSKIGKVFVKMHKSCK